MALSFVQYAGNGSTQTFAIPFTYLNKSDISVKVGLDLNPSFTFDDDQTIRITPAPANASVVEIRRNTPRDVRLVDFTDGSVLTESDLDLANIQVFYIVQEAIDIAGGTLELQSDGSYSAGGRRIAGVGEAVNANDAVTKQYHDGTFIPQMTAILGQAEGFKNQAAASATAAATWNPTNYYTKTQIDATFGSYYTKAQVDTTFGSYYTKTQADARYIKDLSTSEVDTGRKWIDGNTIYRKVINTGALPSSGTKSVAHGLTGPFFILSVTGIASRATDNVALPFVHPANISFAIALMATPTNINIVVGTDQSSYTTSYVVIEYVKA